MEGKNIKQEIKKQLAVIRVKGIPGIKSDINLTLDMLRLYKKNYCSIFPDTPSYSGMVKKVKDFVTWGEINDEVFKELINKRGEEYKGRETDSRGKIKYNDYLNFNGKKIKKFFRLNSPKKGYGRKGIKASFVKGGALGYRGDKINDLIKRMI